MLNARGTVLIFAGTGAKVLRLVCYRQRRRREIFVEQNKNDSSAPSGAASSVHGQHVRANDFPKMPLLTELGFLWGWVFYKYVAPTALGFASKFTAGKSAQAIGSEHRQEFRLAADITIDRSFCKREALKAGTLVVRMVSRLLSR
jgi:hypothetical protein